MSKDNCKPLTTDYLLKSVYEKRRTRWKAIKSNEYLRDNGLLKHMPFPLASNSVLYINLYPAKVENMKNS
jgi:hypothetical protein